MSKVAAAITSPATKAAKQENSTKSLRSIRIRAPSPLLRGLRLASKRLIMAKDRARGHRLEAARLALPVWPVEGLAEVQEPGRASGEARGRGRMGAIVMAGDPGFWDVAWNWPLPFVTAVAVLAVPMAGIIWFICQLRYKQQIATLKDRVELADERLGDAKEKIVKAEEEKTALHTTVKELNAQIEKRLSRPKHQLRVASATEWVTELPLGTAPVIGWRRRMACPIWTQE